MKKNDIAMLNSIRRWLDSDSRTDDAIIEGARLVLQLNRNKNMYMATMRKPSAMAAKIEHELKKHLRYYADGLTLVEVERMSQQVMAEVAPVIADEQHVIATEEPETLAVQMDKRRGKRDDHAALDVSVSALWEKNGERWKKIKALYNTCLQLKEPCERYEYLKQLKEVWYAYKKDMARYDDAKPGTTIASAAERTVGTDAKSAHPYISKNLPVLEQLTADGTDEQRRQRLQENVRQRLDILIAAGETVKDETLARLAAVGVTAS